MQEDYIKEVKRLVQEHKENGFRYAKPIDMLLERVSDTKENVEKELTDFKDLKYCQKQERKGETRYTLYYIYSNKKGRIYALAFEDKIVIITMFPVGRKTLKKYRKKFIS